MSVRVLGGIGGSALKLKPYRAARSNPVYNRAAYCAVPPSSPGEREGELKMDKEKETKPRPPAEHQHGESKTQADVMTDSFGVGYSTRCDEEGFGGIYGGNNSVANHPDYDKSQGSEMKEEEKEKSRNLKHDAHTA